LLILWAFMKLAREVIHEVFEVDAILLLTLSTRM
jgi:hypothetical protein